MFFCLSTGVAPLFVFKYPLLKGLWHRNANAIWQPVNGNWTWRKSYIVLNILLRIIFILCFVWSTLEPGVAINGFKPLFLKKKKNCLPKLRLVLKWVKYVAIIKCLYSILHFCSHVKVKNCVHLEKLVYCVALVLWHNSMYNIIAFFQISFITHFSMGADTGRLQDGLCATLLIYN